jgi:hypothetical protein
MDVISYWFPGEAPVIYAFMDVLLTCHVEQSRDPQFITYFLSHLLLTMRVDLTHGGFVLAIWGFMTYFDLEGHPPPFMKASLPELRTRPHFGGNF